MKKIYPYILPLSLIAGVVVLAGFKIAYHRNIWGDNYPDFDIIIICAYLLWMLHEVRVAGNDAGRNAVVSDRGSREFYGASHALTVFSALWFEPAWRQAEIPHLVGISVLVAGVSLRLWAIWTLGKYYSHTVRKIEGHAIIDAGPYRYVRHPAYAGMITAHAGITMFYFNYITCAIFLFLLMPSIVMRIYVEEKTLVTIEGYREYSGTRKRLLPRVW